MMKIFYVKNAKMQSYDEGYDDLALKINLDPKEYVKDQICSIKNYNCCEDIYENCPWLTNIQDLSLLSLLFRHFKIHL